MKHPAISLLLFALCVPPLAAQDKPAAEAAKPAAEAETPKDIGWPREFKTDNHTVVVFQPQVEEWVEFKTLKMRAAVAVSETGKEEEAQYGGLFAEVTHRRGLRHPPGAAHRPQGDQADFPGGRRDGDASGWPAS